MTKMATLDHSARAKGIGGSELAAILGLDPYRTPLDVWMEKTGRVPKFEGNEATFRGNALEEAVGKYMERKLGEDWKRLPDEYWVHPDYHWMRGYPDRLFCNKHTGERKGGELKTTIDRVDIEDLTDSENPKKLPWLFQCQWYMTLTGCKTWELGWLGAYFNYQQVTIAYDENLANLLIAHVGDWWQRHIIEDIQPDPINASDALILWPGDNGESFEASDILADSIRLYSDFKARAKEASTKADELADRIKLTFGGYSTATIGGVRAASYKADKNGKKSLRIHL